MHDRVKSRRHSKGEHGPRAVAAMCVLAMAHAGAAEQVAAAAASPQTQDKVMAVEVQGRRIGVEQERREGTGIKYIVSRADLARYGDSRTLDVLRRVPGLSVDPDGGEIRMRGLGTGYVQVLLDGRPAGESFSFDSITPDLIERIEILGSPSADRSTQAIAGTINIVLRRGGKSVKPVVKAGASLQDGKLSPSLSIQARNKLEDLSFSVAATVARENVERVLERREYGVIGQDDGRYERSGAIRTFDRSRPASATVQADWQPDPETRLSATLLLNLNDSAAQTTERTATVAGADLQYPSSRLALEARSRSARLNLTGSRQLDQFQMIELDGTAGATRRSSDAGFSGLGRHEELLLQRDVDGKLSEDTGNLSFAYSRSGSGNHTLKLGAETDHTRRSDARIQRDQTFDATLPINLDEHFDATVHKTSVYFQDEWKGKAGWSAYAGMRWENLSTRAASAGETALRKRYRMASPIVQLAWKTPETGRNRFTVGLSRTYRPPTAASLIPRRFYAVNNGPLRADTTGNPALKPELSWTLDGSYQHEFDNKGNIGINLAASRVSDVILSDVRQAGQAWLIVPENHGSADVRSVTLEASLPLSGLLAWRVPLSLTANATRNWSQVEQLPGPHNYLAQQLPFSANLALDAGNEKSTYGAGVSASLQSGSTIRSGQQQQLIRKSYASVDLYAVARLSPSARLRLSIANLAPRDARSDQIYFDASRRDVVANTSQAFATIRLFWEGQFN